MGYEKHEAKVKISSHQRSKLNVKLKPSTQLAEVIVVSNPLSKVKNSAFNATAVDGENRHEGRRRHSEFGRWQQVYEELHNQNPEAAQITIGSENASVTLGNTGNGRASDRYEFNRRSGEVSLTTKYADSNEADKLRGWIYSIHTGSLGGLFTRILWLLGALLGASLPLTGYYIWIKHLLKKEKHH